MNLKNRFVKSLAAMGVIAAMGVGVVAATETAADAKPGCACPLYYAPVLCDNGQTYSNICFAGCAGATGCVPVGPGPIPF